MHSYYIFNDIDIGKVKAKNYKNKDLTKKVIIF